MLITKEVEVGLGAKNIKWYENKGYEIPKIKDKWGKIRIKQGTKIKVEINDLIENSNAKVDIQCDGCGRIINNVLWQNYKKCVKDDGKYYCNICAKNIYKKFISFYDWCYENLSKEEADNIIARWDYEKNIDKDGNKLTPNNISYGMIGINRKGYWFKCLDHHEHESEQKNINSFTSGNGSITCNQCNTISITNPELVKYLVNKEDAYKYSVGSNIKILMKCPDCGHEKSRSLEKLKEKGFCCEKCSDKIPFGEKFIFNILEQLRKDFKCQLNKSTFKWCNTYRYDFYLDNYKMIIETDGLQHYEELKGNWRMKLNEIQENDKNKEQLARQNGIEHYIVIDCRESKMDWIKNSIMKSDLPTLLNFKESDIDWLKCYECACNSLVIKVCDMWNSGICNTLELAEKLKISRRTVIKYLKQGVILKMCNYNPIEELNKSRINPIKTICITTNEIFNSISEAYRKYNISTPSIVLCCQGKRNYAGKHPITGEHMVWMYYEEYIDNKE